jgi:hypothetical protein
VALPLGKTNKKVMKMNNAIEGGIAGAATLGLITETLKNINGSSSHVNLFKKNNLQKRLSKTRGKKGAKATRQYLRLAADLLGSTAYFGLSALGKKENAMLRGGVLGTAAGLGTIFLNGEKHKNDEKPYPSKNEEKPITKVLKVSLYTIAGLIAGKVIQDFEEGTKKSKKKKRVKF